MALVPRELHVLNLLKAHLEGITPTEDNPSTLAPYKFDLTQEAVFFGRRLFSKDEVPAVSMLEKPVPEDLVFADTERLIGHGPWTILLQGFAPEDKDNPTAPAYELKAEVISRLAMILAVKQDTGLPRFPDVYLLGKMITGMTIGQGVVRPPDEVSNTAYFYVPLVISMKTDNLNPYVEVP